MCRIVFSRTVAQVSWVRSDTDFLTVSRNRRTKEKKKFRFAERSAKSDTHPQLAAHWNDFHLKVYMSVLPFFNWISRRDVTDGRPRCCRLHYSCDLITRHEIKMAIYFYTSQNVPHLSVGGVLTFHAETKLGSPVHWERDWPSGRFPVHGCRWNITQKEEKIWWRPGSQTEGKVAIGSTCEGGRTA